jgi:hypothetical protein
MGAFMAAFVAGGKGVLIVGPGHGPAVASHLWMT